MIEKHRTHLLSCVAALTLCVVAAAPLRAETPTSADARPNAGADRVSMRLRMEWGGGAARRWRGLAEIVDGELTRPITLGIEADEPGSMWSDGVRWHLEPRTPRSYDGVDISLTGPRDGTMVVTLTDIDGGPTLRQEIPVRTLLSDAYHAALDNSGNRIAVRRGPGCRLRTEIPHASLIFAPGDVLKINVRPHLLEFAAGSELALSASIRRARRTEVIWNGSIDVVAPADDGAWPVVPVNLGVPDDEGVYDVVLELRPRKSEPQATPLVVETRKVQFVVLSPKPPDRRTSATPTPSHIVQEIDPTSPGWAERLKQMTPLVGGVRRAPLGNVRPTMRTIQKSTFAEMPPTREPGDFAWQAFPLTVAKPGTPHIVEIEYPSGVAQSFGVSLLEPGTVGAVSPLGIDVGLHIDPSDIETSSRTLTHRVVVWPQTTTPLLVLTNHRRDAPAVYGKIRLRGAEPASGSYLSRQAEVAEGLSAAPMPEGSGGERLLAAYFDRPLFPENFAATATTDPDDDSSVRKLDDWVTFYDGAQRLFDYLAHAGYNGLMLTVAADGSAIYPSAYLAPTPRYDDGTFFAAGQDPLRKDVVELLLRMCDREGLRFVPAVQFSGPLPALEDERRTLNATLEPRGIDGRSWSEVHGQIGGAGPRYNPLDPRVQREMTRVVEELTQRYGHHRSLAGIGVHLSADGYTQLPGIEWGLDAETIGRFMKETRIALSPHFRTPDLASLIVDRHRENWLAWRKDGLQRFYRDLSRTATGDASTRRLYLISTHAWRRDDLEPRLQTQLGSRAPFEAIMEESGLGLAQLVKEPQIAWLRPYADVPLHDPAAHDVAIALNEDEALDRIAGEAAWKGSVIFHSTELHRLESLEKQSPFAPAEVRLISQSASGGAAARRRLVRQMAMLDASETFCGGWTLPLVTHDETRRIAYVLRALPVERFTPLDGTPSHCVVRTLKQDDVSWVYVVNDSPWPTVVTLDVAASAEAKWISISPDASTSELRVEGERRTLQIKLEPYDLGAGKIVGGAGDVVIRAPQATLPDGVGDRLTAQIRQLWARTAALQRTPPARDLLNSGFETAATPEAPLPGWEASNSIDVRRETLQPHGGLQCAALGSTQGGAWMRSTPVTAPPSGRMSISAWLRTTPKERPTVRIALEGRLAGQPYFRFASVGTGGDGPELDDEWRLFVFPLYDLPAAGLTDLRVRFELVGVGEIYVDDVRVTELEFTANERLELSKIISLAEYRLQRGEYGACAKLLEGYWPRYLAAYVPAVEDGGKDGVPAVAARRPPAAVAEPDAAGLRDRLKKWVPDFLR